LSYHELRTRPLQALEVHYNPAILFPFSNFTHAILFQLFQIPDESSEFGCWSSIVIAERNSGGKDNISGQHHVDVMIKPEPQSDIVK